VGQGGGQADQGNADKSFADSLPRPRRDQADGEVADCDVDLPRGCCAMPGAWCRQKAEAFRANLDRLIAETVGHFQGLFERSDGA
jgi:hypothetical protein